MKLLSLLVLVNALAFGQTWKTLNGGTVGGSTGNISSVDGISVGNTTGKLVTWNILTLSGAAPSHPKQKFFASYVTTGAAVYLGLQSSGGASQSVATIEPMALAGNFRKMYVILNGDPDSGGSSKGYVFTLKKSGASTAVTATILSSTASFESSYTGADVHFAATDTATIEITKSSTPANSPQASIILEFEADADDGSTIIPTGSRGNLTANADNIYVSLAGEQNYTTESYTTMVAPCAGSITSFVANLATVPGTGGSRTFTLRQNGSNVGTAITFTAAQNGIQTQSESITVAQGDRLGIIANYSTAAAASNSGFTVVFKPTVTGNFIIPTNTYNSVLGASATSYIPLAGITNAAIATTETQQNVASADFSLKGWTAYLATTPGGGAKKWTISLREQSGAAPTTYSTDMTTQGPTTSVATAYAIPTNYFLYDTMVVPTSSPATSRLAISYLGYIAP